MHSFRRIVGGFIIVGFGVPLLFAITWAVGLTRAATSPKLVSEVPEKIIGAMPGLIDEIVRDGQDPDIVRDPEARAWLAAVAKSGVSVKDILAQTGVTAWLQGELKTALGEVGEVLKGDRPPHRVTIDLRPLKQALRDPRFADFAVGVLSNLPPCDADASARWLEASREGWRDVRLPACRPSDMAVAADAVKAEQSRVAGRMRDEVQILEGLHELPPGFAPMMTFFVYGLFIIPAFFILGGALVASASPQEFLRWSGIPTLVGGGAALGLAVFIRASAEFALKWTPLHRAHEWGTDFGPLVLDKTRWAVKLVLSQIMNPVMAAAGIVCVVGLVLFVLSFSARGPQPRPLPAAPPAVPPAR